MKYKLVKTALSAVCTCSVIMSALALAGCSKRTNEQRYETPADDPAVESSGESMVSSEENTSSSEESTSSSEESTISSEESTASSSDESQPYEELLLDQQLLETVEKDRLYVWIHLGMDDEALREEYNELYPNIGENPHHWFRFLCNCGGQKVREFLPDYDINYEDLGVIESSATICGEFDKVTLSLMLNDPRVKEIYYFPAGPEIFSEQNLPLRNK